MKLSVILQNAVSALYDGQVSADMVQVQKTRKEFDGDLTVVVFPLLKFSKKSPEETGKELGNYLQQNVSEVVVFNVVKGFLNLTISDEYWLNQFNEISQKESYGFAEKNLGITTMVEYSSPNTNKPLHLGHIRNCLLGWSVAEILKANGHNVIKTQIINDRGIHICKSMLAWQKWGNGEEPSDEKKGDKLVGEYYVEFDRKHKLEISQTASVSETDAVSKPRTQLLSEAQQLLRKWEAKDTEVYALWKKMNGWVYEGFDVTYKRMGIDFDQLYYESDTYLNGKEIVLKGLEKDIFFKKDDGSVWCDLTKEGLDEKLLLRADGTSVYITQDIGTAIKRFEGFPELAKQIYVVGSEQNYHFKVLFFILKKLGYEWADECLHLSYGMIDLPSGKMKSREGTVVDADDLMQEMHKTAKAITEELSKVEEIPENERDELYWMVGLGALKYFILKVDPKKKMLFDPKESVDFHGNTGPFIQYTYARIQSVLRKAKENLEFRIQHVALQREEKEIIKLICEYPQIIKEAGENYSPALIANYAYELTKSFNHFYQSISILAAETDELIAFRVALSEMSGKVLKSALGLLGIEVPERM